MAQSEVKSRKSNIELLRVLAMLMIITLHYLDKGEILVEFSEMSTWNHYLAWLVEGFCYVAVNLYVLISGYFLVQSKFSVQKLFVLWAQIAFYSWVIGAAFLLTGQAGEGATSLYELIFIAFPVTSGHYWFATIYLLLFAIFPFLNAGIEKMNRKQHLSCIAVLLVIFSAWNTVIPFTIPLTDNEGMDIAWFVCLYMIAAYLRKYPDCMKLKRYQYVIGYVLCSVLIFVTGLLILFVDSKVGKLGGYATNWYAYNSLPILCGSVCLFVTFVKTEIKGNAIGRIINTMAGATFGVYLIHEHRYLRYLWQTWLSVDKFAEGPWMLLYMVGCVLAVFLVGALIDLLRKFLFSLVTKRKWFQNIFKRFEKWEAKINGDAE